MDSESILDIPDEIALQYPMKYKFPELNDHWGEDVKKATFVTYSTYHKAYSRIKQLEQARLDILEHGEGYRDTIKDLKAQIEKLKNNNAEPEVQ